MSSLFQHVLVPVDFTEKNDRALEVALELARSGGARLSLLHVIETIDVTPEEEMRDFYSKLQTQAQTNLDLMAKRCGDQTSGTECEIIFGKRITEIIQYSASRDIDLVIMSSHKVDLENPTEGWGTLSHQVSVLCQCPVLLVK